MEWGGPTADCNINWSSMFGPHGKFISWYECFPGPDRYESFPGTYAESGPQPRPSRVMWFHCNFLVGCVLLALEFDSARRTAVAVCLANCNFKVSVANDLMIAVSGSNTRKANTVSGKQIAVVSTTPQIRKTYDY